MENLIPELAVTAILIDPKTNLPITEQQMEALKAEELQALNAMTAALVEEVEEDVNVPQAVDVDAEIDLVYQALSDCESFERAARAYICLLRTGKKAKGTKIAAQAKKHRVNILISALNDLKYSVLG